MIHMKDQKKCRRCDIKHINKREICREFQRNKNRFSNLATEEDPEDEDEEEVPQETPSKIWGSRRNKIKKRKKVKNPNKKDETSFKRMLSKEITKQALNIKQQMPQDKEEELRTQSQQRERNPRPRNEERNPMKGLLPMGLIQNSIKEAMKSIIEEIKPMILDMIKQEISRTIKTELSSMF